MEINFPALEHKILEFWEKNKIFKKSIKQRVRDFVFYEGPPTANGKPGLHHVLARCYKDIICRYKTMRGFRVLRKAGWDTHGLPVELEIEKKLGLKNKKDIEQYGIAEFNKKCRESVWQYQDEWEKLTTRIGFWLDMTNPYITYENNYIESLWWIIKQIHQKGLLYKGHKVVPYCPRCGTALSSHEVAQGYQTIKENSIFVKFKIKHPNTYLLVWTTTPWTLPANVAIAVNSEFIYAKVKMGEDHLILAKERLSILTREYKIVEELKGKELLGLKYEPLFPAASIPYQVVSGDFVSLEEGTGLVHIAPAFGEDDMQVGKENNLPVILNVDEEGKFKKEVANWAGMFVKDADPLIVENLKKRNLLFKEELNEHDYPFCWRCSSPLLYYAKESWFINMQQVKKDLIQNSQKINWVPAYLKEGRFGEWLKEVKDWAFSRERYWGTPLPVWECKSCNKLEVIGSKKDLLLQKFTTNKYFILRHGETIYQTKLNKRMYPSSNPQSEIPPVELTKRGKETIKSLIPKLKKSKIDLIFSSDFFRTKETADIIAKELGLKIYFDKRLRDIDMGAYHGEAREMLYKDFPDEKMKERFYKKLKNGESWSDCKRRMINFIRDINKKYKDKTILIISHGDPLWLLEGTLDGLSDEELLKQKIQKKTIKTGGLGEINFGLLPFNEKMTLDFHRPYIDEVKFLCPKCNGPMERVPELVDVWFDSGSMPFAQHHYPFEKNIQFPADYICEAIDQTRGWFYTLLAVATLFGRSAPYKNVISLGHVLDEKGEKMSKSKGNVVDPWQIIEKYGSDAVRWYFYTVNQPGDVKLFAEKDVGENLKKFIMTYWNCYLFFNTYQNPKPVRRRTSNNVLDKWVISRLNELILEATQRLDQYDVTSAARSIEAFVINDLSLWYIRRSRKRFQEAAPTLNFVLLTLAKLTAPFVPFLSEEIYQGLNKKQSCHLTDWPKANRKLINKKLNQEMEKVRGIVSLALAERAKAGIKVRQPLQELRIPDKISADLLDLIKEEINVKKISSGKELKLNMAITQELREEGMVREVIRQIQEMRKKAGLKPKDRILIQYFGTPEANEILTKNKNFILKETKAKDFSLASKLKVDQQKLALTIKKL